MRHASFFSGVGGLDLGFHRAGITTVSVSEIDPYASSVLAERFPDAPNLGNILEVAANDIPDADIWSGGFPCQDLSAAGKRRGFAAGTRSSLAFRFLDLVEQRRPNWLVLENVPGLLTSNRGADFARLLSEMVELGYSISWRVLDAQHFGVAQRRRRVFIVGNLGADRAAEVLLECTRCERHPAPSRSQGQSASSGVARSSGISGAGVKRQQDQAPYTDGMRAADGLARRLDDQRIVDTFGATTHRTLQARDWKGGVNNQDLNDLQANRALLVGETIMSFPSRFGSNADVSTNRAQSMAHSAGAPAVFRKSQRARSTTDSETWVEGRIANTLNTFDVGDTRTTHAVVSDEKPADDPLLPQGIDSHRYRCCGNGVVAPVAEWIGRRIVAVEQR